MTESEAIKRCEMLIKGFSVNHATYEAFAEDGKGYPTFNTMKEFAEACKYALEEVEQYRAIGTVEECRIAVEKHNKKIKPLKVHNRFVCPCCTNSTQEVILTEHTEYCFVCGQGFDWSEGE